ncbi:hypothetical protein [Mycobacterium attenuatum]|uniref:hypothetical protein n=1 Tax=Mycobacterium attenuatum TaxID=2341086 RepID=UPI000F023A15|nr:hypothetical protein [Mycobacterium attenuatum]VBA45415.1 hypothetical protein LAUMK41_00121 [Mycobacterium attenuatum]
MGYTADVGHGSHVLIGVPARVARSLSEMRTGTVLLSVPLLDDVIQVGTAGAPATGIIDVTKTPSTMVVRRTDGRRLQARILQQHAGGFASRTPVFLEPVRSLRLQCVPRADAPELWLVLPGVQIRRRPDLFQLLETITAFGLAKQRRQHCLPAAATPR